MIAQLIFIELFTFEYISQLYPILPRCSYSPQFTGNNLNSVFNKLNCAQGIGLTVVLHIDLTNL